MSDFGSIIDGISYGIAHQKDENDRLRLQMAWKEAVSRKKHSSPPKPGDQALIKEFGDDTSKELGRFVIDPR
jgi:hypothetical protein